MIHLNGTHPQVLYDQLHAASRALQDAGAALAAAAPNARDYYPLGPDAFGVAQAEHEARLATIWRLRAEVETAIEHVIAFGGGKVEP